MQHTCASEVLASSDALVVGGTRSEVVLAGFATCLVFIFLAAGCSCTTAGSIGNSLFNVWLNGQNTLSQSPDCFGQGIF